MPQSNDPGLRQAGFGSRSRTAEPRDGPRQSGSGKQQSPFLKACWAFASLCGWRGRALRWLRSSDHNRRSIPVSL